MSQERGGFWAFLGALGFGVLGAIQTFRPNPAAAVWIAIAVALYLAGKLVLYALDLWLSHRRHVTPVDAPRPRIANVKVQRDEPFRVSTKPERSGRRSV